MQDDELKDALGEARQSDREAAPSFGATWAAAVERGAGARRRKVWAGAVAIVAIVVALVTLWPDATSRHLAPAPEVAETEPQPDVPLEEPTTADWSAAPLGDTPTDFLLEESGMLAGDLPCDQLVPTDAFDLDDDSLREL